MSEPGRIRVEFQLTVDDLREAMRAHRRKTVRRIFAILAFTVAFNVLLRIFAPGTEPEEKRVVSLGELLVQLGPWIVFFGVIWFFVFRMLRAGSIEVIYRETPRLQIPRAVEADQHRVWFVDALVRSECQWQSFVKFLETPNLFLLYWSRDVFQIVPKRSFPNAAAIDWFRGTLVHYTAAKAVQPPTA